MSIKERMNEDASAFGARAVFYGMIIEMMVSEMDNDQVRKLVACCSALTSDDAAVRASMAHAIDDTTKWMEERRPSSTLKA